MIDNNALLAKSAFNRPPFHVVPIESHLVWAGSGSVRGELSRIVNEIRYGQLELSHLALIYGEYGSGKTHAMKFMARHLREQGKSLVAYLAKPKVEKKGSFQGITKEVVKQIGKAPLAQAVEPLINYLRDETNRQVTEAMRQGIEGDVIKFTEEQKTIARRGIQETLCPVFPEIINVFEGLVAGDAEAWNYFASKPAKAALQKYELNSPIEDDHDALRALIALYTVLTTHYPEIPGTPIYHGAYLFIDELEQFLEMKADEYQSIRTGLRELFNGCTEHLCILLAATAENASLFHGMLEEALMVRVTAEPIHVRSHDQVADGVQFIKELMRYARNGIVPPSDEHPFTPEALEEIVNRTTEPRTARKLIQNSNRVWQGCAEAILNGGVISEADVQSVPGLN